MASLCHISICAIGVRKVPHSPARLGHSKIWLLCVCHVYLKTKTINIKQSDEKSVVSISELEDMKDSLEKPKKSRRKKQKSERNAISLNFN